MLLPHLEPRRFKEGVDRGAGSIRAATEASSANVRDVHPALQEVPKGITLEDVAKHSSGLMRAVEKTIGEKVLLVHSRDVAASRVSIRPRMVGATFGGASWGGLQGLGVHLDNRWSNPEGQGRGVDASKWQSDFLSFWKGGPLVALGDFNAEPHHPEVCARDGGFFAVRDRDTLSRPPVVVHESLRLPLYNPMWSHLQEKDGSVPRGTHHYEHDQKGIGPWVYDQILVSRELVVGLRGTPSIWGNMGGTRYLTRRDGRSDGGYPRSVDHLPVGAFVDLEEVYLCRI